MLIPKRDKVVGLILHGSGSDATAILNAWLDDKMPCGIRIGVAVVTNKNAGFFERKEDFPGKEFPLPVVTLDFKDYQKARQFSHYQKEHLLHVYSVDISKIMHEHGVKLVFYVGNVFKLNPMDVPTYNIHPAKKKKHGGRHYYGVHVHKSVLEEICTDIWREAVRMNDSHYTVVTVHEVNKKLDDGHNLLEVEVEIPSEIVADYYQLFVRRKKALDYLEKNGGTVDKAIELSAMLKEMTALAKKMQDHVLKFEWSILPKAVEIAAMKLDSK